MCSLTDFLWERNILVNITDLQPIQFSLPLTFPIFIPFSSSTQMPYLDYASAVWLLLECRNASGARTAIPKHFFHGGDNRLPRKIWDHSWDLSSETTPEISAHHHCPGCLWLVLPKKPLAAYTCLAGTELGLPGGRVVKNLPAKAGDTRDAGLIPVSGRSPRGGNGNMLQYSCLENSMDRGTWWATLHGVAKSDMIEHTHTHAGTELPDEWQCR